jgi:glyoxylase-like metal-dependent hydrolase (beta-lactamase superfamily II)
VTPIPFVPSLDDVHYGHVEHVSARIRRVIAENPSKYSYRGTGTYVVGQGTVAVIDPGPDLASHRDALAAALVGEKVVAIVVTHCHADHSPLAAWLAAETGAPTVAVGPHPAIELPEDGLLDDEWSDLDDADLAGADDAAVDRTDEPRETIDTAFTPDIRVADGEPVAEAPGWTLTAVHTPGHTSNHLCVAFPEERALFSGDHVMGWSTTVVSPPDGDMRAYVESLRKVQGRHDAVLWPTHGNPITEPGPFLRAYLAHRLERESQVLDSIRHGRVRVRPVVDALYVDVPRHLHRAAGRSVLAHLVKLVDDGHVEVEGGGPATLGATYRAV